MNNCAVTSDLNRYLRKLDEEDGRKSVIDERTAEGLAGEYSPRDFQNIMEALGEIDEETIGDLAASVRSAQNGATKEDRNISYQIAGKRLVLFVESFWAASAKRLAESSVNNAECHACFDQGCPKCEGVSATENNCK